jgi:hypothetical protein
MKSPLQGSLFDDHDIDDDDVRADPGDDDDLCDPPDPAGVRRRLEDLLAEMRAAERLEWEDTVARAWRLIVPQMTNWLPDDERARICAEFDREIARLDPDGRTLPLPLPPDLPDWE